jgi:hypothetical protein
MGGGCGVRAKIIPRYIPRYFRGHVHGPQERARYLAQFPCDNSEFQGQEAGTSSERPPRIQWIALYCRRDKYRAVKRPVKLSIF